MSTATGIKKGLPVAAGGILDNPPVNAVGWPLQAGRCAVVWNIAAGEVDSRDPDYYPDAAPLRNTVVRIRPSRSFVTYRGDPTPVTVILRDIVCKIRNNHLVAPDGNPFLILIPTSGGNIEGGWQYTATLEQAGKILYTVMFDAPNDSTVDLTLAAEADASPTIRTDDLNLLLDRFHEVFTTEEGASLVATTPGAYEKLKENNLWRNIIDRDELFFECIYFPWLMSHESFIKYSNREIFSGYIRSWILQSENNARRILEVGLWDVFFSYGGAMISSSVWKPYIHKIAADTSFLLKELYKSAYDGDSLWTNGDFMAEVLKNEKFINSVFPPLLTRLIADANTTKPLANHFRLQDENGNDTAIGRMFDRWDNYGNKLEFNIFITQEREETLRLFNNWVSGIRVGQLGVINLNPVMGTTGGQIRMFLPGCTTPISPQIRKTPSFGYNIWFLPGTRFDLDDNIIPLQPAIITIPGEA